MIIIEGNDNSGKTTLIQRLAEDLKITVVRSYHRPWTAQSIENYDNWLAGAPQPLILDRHPLISDLIYGPIIRGHTSSTRAHAKRLVSTSTTFLVYCRPPLTTMTNTLRARSQMVGVTENFLQISGAYDDLMDTLDPHFTYDFTNPHHYGELIDDYHHTIRTNI